MEIFNTNGFFISIFFIFNLLFSGIFSSKDGNSKLDLREAFQVAIDYYNKSMNLAEKAEMVEKYYELARDDGIFMPARLLLPPEKMTEISEELDRIERSAQLNNQLDYSSLKPGILQVQKDLEYQYGPEDRNFRVVSTDPMAQNMKALKRMKEHWESLMKDFVEYTTVQHKIVDAMEELRKIGIWLHPEDYDIVVLITDEERYSSLIEKYPLKKDAVKGADIFDYEDFHNFVRKYPKAVPKQTSQEIQALQNAMLGLEMDPVSKQLLTGFIPELNKKADIIVKRMMRLEEIVDTIDDEGQDYAFYYMDKRDELYRQLNRVKGLVGLGRDEGHNEEADFGGFLKDEL